MTTAAAEKHITFTLGRFNPPTTGHSKLINAVTDHAKKHGGDHIIFASHSHDAKKNPLPHKQKTELMTKMWPHANIDQGEGVKTPIDAVKHLSKKGYTHIHMVVGSDRHHDMSNLLHKYNGSEYHVKHLEVHSPKGLERDPDADDSSGMSASKMREHASAKRFSEFKKGVPNAKHARELYTAVRKGMKLEQYQAVILVGGPGSGKDFILREALSGTATEVPLGALISPVGEPLIINGNAQDYDDVVVEGAALQELGYQVAMVYVYTTDDASRARNEARIRRGDRTISEGARAAKWQQAIKAMGEYQHLFGEGFVLFDNSADLKSLDEQAKQQIDSWLVELPAIVEAYFEKPVMGIAAPKVPTQVAGSHSVPANHKRVMTANGAKVVHVDDHRYKGHPTVEATLQKHGKHTGPEQCDDCGGTGAVDDQDCPGCKGTGSVGSQNPDDDQNTTESVDPSLDALFEKTYPTIIDMIAKKGDKRDGEKYGDSNGIAVPGAKARANGSSEVVDDTVNEASNQEVEVPQATKVTTKPKGPKKGANPPGDYFNSKIGSVPSGGIGLTSINTESTEPTRKPFNSIRKRTS